MTFKKTLAGITLVAATIFLVGISPAFADTAGYSSIGASTYQAGTATGNANPSGLLVTFASAGSVTKITAYVAENISSGSLTAKIYNGTAGSLGSLISTTNAATVTTSFAWVDFTFASPVAVTAQTYWIEFSGDGGAGPGTNVASQKYDGGGAANTGYQKNDGGTPVYDSNQYSMYATYTASAAATPITPSNSSIVNATGYVVGATAYIK